MAVHGLSKASLRANILAMVLGSMLITATVSGVLMYRAVASQTDAVLSSFEGFAIEVGNRIGDRYRELYIAAQLIAENPVLYVREPNEINATLDHYVAKNPWFDMIVLTDAQGHYKSSNTRSAQGAELDLTNLKTMNFAGTEWFKAVASGATTDDPARELKGTYFEDAQIDPLSSSAYRSQRYGTSFSVPVVDANGAFAGALSVRVDFAWVEQLMNNFELVMGLEHIAASSNYLITNKKGTLILDSDGNEAKTADKRNFETLLKFNLLESGSVPAQQATTKVSGYGRAPNTRTHAVTAYGFTRLDARGMPSEAGWTMFLRADPTDALADVKEMENNFAIGIAVAVILFTFTGLLYSSRLARRYGDVSSQLQTTAERTNATASELTSASRSVADASTEQAAAVQETVAAMSEISSMIGQTTKNVGECTDIAGKVAGKADSGNQVMRRLATAIDAVQQANGQLKEMASIISEVSNKTNVINDIVFKTQLLSINASIEAARAGQQGKGFAVVAEEVGNLAQMSGAASKEIQLLIQESQKKVAHIIDVTQARARESQTVAGEALAAFSDINSGLAAINERFLSVSQATREQEIGIQQINTAMGQMNLTTQRNNAAAVQANDLGQELVEQSEQIDRIMHELGALVHGENSAQATKPRMETEPRSRNKRNGRRGGPTAGVTPPVRKPRTEGLAAQADSLAAKLARTQADAPVNGEAELTADDPEFNRPAA